MIQILIVCIYFFLAILIGFWSKKKMFSSKSFDGSGLGLVLCVAAGAGEWLGGTSTTGVAEYGYEYGLAGAWYTIANGIGICFLAIFFAKKYRELNQKTVSGMVGHYIGEKSRMASSVLLIFVMMAVGASQMVAIGTLGEALFHIDAYVAIPVMGIGVLLYTVAGGMLAVGYTNILHMLVMYAGSIFAVFLCIKNIGNLDMLTQNLPESYFEMSSIGTSKVSSWILASLLGACVAQAGIQPILGTKDTKTAVKSSYLIALIVTPFGFLTALLGMYAKVKFPNLSNAKMALPVLLMEMDPIAGGLVIASIFAAILSTASPIFLSCGTLFTRDVYVKLDKHAEERPDSHTLKVSKLATMMAGVVCILLALAFYGSQRLLDIVYFAYSMRGSLFVILMMGMFWRRLSQKAANIAMLSTTVVGLFWVVYKAIVGNYPIHPAFSETYACILAALLVSVLGTYVLKERQKKA